MWTTKVFRVEVFLAVNILGHLVSADVYERTNIWDNYKDFLDYGWVIPSTAYEHVEAFQKPSELDSFLLNLNDNTTEIWGWKNNFTRNHYFRFVLDLDEKPEHCGLLYAFVSVRYYIRKFTTSGIGPCQGCSFSENFQASETVQWRTLRHSIPLSRGRMIVMEMNMQPGGIVAFDEVSLTTVVRQDNSNCPKSCHSDCKAVGTDCHNYYTCIDGVQKEFHSCKIEDGLAFNPKTESCDRIENVKECDPIMKPNKPKCKCEYRPHEDNNTLYYFCPDTCNPEGCIEKACPGGLEWTKDPELRLYQCAPTGVLAL